MILTLVGLAGGAVGGLYSWAASLYSYNREAWMTDITILQQHDYQYDNMQIAAHTMSRDQVRDRTEAAITKLNNYILVTTLIISLAAEMLTEGQIPRNCADFVLNVYMLCLGSAVLYLALGALFGVAASNVIYETSADLLTTKVPPPWPVIDKKMKDREEHKMTGAFERRPIRQLFMPPLFRRAWPRVFGEAASPSPWGPRRQSSGGSASVPGAGAAYAAVEATGPAAGSAVGSAAVWGDGGGTAGCCAEEDSDCEPRGEHGDERGRGWDRDAGSGRRYGIPEPRKPSVQFTSPACASAAPASSSAAAPTLPPLSAPSPPALPTLRTRQASHFSCDTAMPEEDEALTTIGEDYEKRWREQEQLWGPLFDFSRKCVALGLKNLLEAYGYLCMANLYSAYGSAWAFWAVQIIFTSLNLLITRSMFVINSWWHGPTVILGPVSCAIAATTPFVCVDRILVPVCYISHCALAWVFGVPLTPEEREAVAKQARKLGLLCEPGSHDEPQETPAPTPTGNRKRKLSRSHHLIDSTEQSLRTFGLVRTMVQWGGLVIKCLWGISVVWAIWKAQTKHGFKNSKAVLRNTPAGPPVAGVCQLDVSWPSPFFRPRALVCPRERVFMADQFRVFELDQSSMRVEPYPCDVNGTIADIASDCDGTGCWPVVLLDGIPPTVFDCARRSKMVLLQAKTSAERFATRRERTLYAAHSGLVVQYDWSDRRQGWMPLWSVADVGEDGLDAMDVVNNWLLLFRTQDARTSGPGSSVEVLNLDSGNTCGVWELPPSLVGAGCAQAGGASVLVLLRAPLQVGPGVRLVRAELQSEGSGPSGCRLGRATAGAAPLRRNGDDVSLRGAGKRGWLTKL